MIVGLWCAVWAMLRAARSRLARIVAGAARLFLRDRRARAIEWSEHVREFPAELYDPTAPERRLVRWTPEEPIRLTYVLTTPPGLPIVRLAIGTEEQVRRGFMAQREFRERWPDGLPVHPGHCITLEVWDRHHGEHDLASVAIFYRRAP